MGSQTIGPLAVDSTQVGQTVDLVFAGVDQAGPSFEGRVFLNNPAADESTARSPDTGYAGSFHVFGYGTPSPPAIAEAQARHQPGDAAIAPIQKRVRADEAALRAALARSRDLTVTVVPVAVDPGGPTPERAFEHLELVFDRARS
jgi:hypothetical protein